MQFNSLSYLIFYPVVFFVYFFLPRRVRYIWLLVASYYFYMSWNAKYALLILFSTAVTYLGGLLLQRIPEHQTRRRKGILAADLAVNLTILFLFKYLGFAVDSLSRLLALFGLPPLQVSLDLLLPVGISFYTFQALGYTIDVYRGTVKAEQNFFKYALFVSFFPQLVAGPIERSANLLRQIDTPTEFDVGNARRGLLTIAYGLFLKLVLADNIAAVIDPLFASWQQQSGAVLLAAILLFAFQIYGDFNGYTQIAIGSARILGFELTENFNSPYLAHSIADFWSRWHISLSSWLQDYLFTPLAWADTGRLFGGHLPAPLCIFIVFFVSGLWHGAKWTFVAWGVTHAVLRIAGQLTRRARARLYGRLGIDTGRPWFRAGQVAATFAMVCGSYVFFRATDLPMAFAVFGRICTDMHPGQLLSMQGLRIFAPQDRFLLNLIAGGAALVLMCVTDVLQYKKIDWQRIILDTWPTAARWAFYVAALLMLLVLGRYGGGQQGAQFIYFQF